MPSHQRVISNGALTDAILGLRHQIVDAGDLRSQLPHADHAHGPRDLDGIMCLARRETSQIDRGGGLQKHIFVQGSVRRGLGLQLDTLAL